LPARKKSKKSAARKTAPSGIDLTLVKALSHPYRFHALKILNERTASPNELAGLLGCDVNKIAYHVRELAKYDCIELVYTRPRRGATEHFYRATRRPHFGHGEWVAIPASLRENINGMQLEEMGKEIARALEGGSFERRADRHCSYVPGRVDDQGWGEAMELLDETLERFYDILAASNGRLVGSEDKGIPIALSMIGFETAPAEEG
jgi:hypothetical protein